MVGLHGQTCAAELPCLAMNNAAGGPGHNRQSSGPGSPFGLAAPLLALPVSRARAVHPVPCPAASSVHRRAVPARFNTRTFPMKNLVILIGRIASTPETRNPGATSVTNFTLVTDRPKLVDGKTVKNEQGYTETVPEFHRITVFNGLGQTVAKHKAKGDLVEVQGRLHYSKWTDKDQVERYAVEIIAEEVLFL
jgi:single-strand DNA-binding protein